MQRALKKAASHRSTTTRLNRVLVLGAVGLLASSAQAVIFSENTNHASNSRFDNNPVAAPYGWLGENGAQTWEIFRKNNPSSVGTGNQITAANAPNDAKRADFSGSYSYNNGGSPQFVGGGVFFGPDGNILSSQPQLVNPAAAVGGAPAALDLRVGFMETAGVANFIENHHGDNRINGPAANLPPNPTPAHDETMDLYAGNWGANGIYFRIQTNPDGTVNRFQGYSMSANSTLPNEGANFAADSGALTVHPGSGNSLGPGPWMINEYITQRADGDVIMHMDFGAFSADWDLSTALQYSAMDSLTADMFGTRYAGGKLSWRNVTPVMFIGAASGDGQQNLTVFLPEPASLALLGLGTLGLIRRPARRR